MQCCFCLLSERKRGMKSSCDKYEKPAIEAEDGQIASEADDVRGAEVLML